MFDRYRVLALSWSLACSFALLLAAAVPLAGCAEIHPDNTPRSPEGHGR